MAKLTRYTRRIDPTGLQNVKQATAATFGGDGGMSTLAAGLAEAGAQLKATNDKRDALEIQKRMAQARADFTEHMIKMKQSAPEGAKGFTDEFKTHMDDFADKTSANFEGVSVENQQQLQIELSRLRGSFMPQAMEFEAVQGAKKVRRDTETALDANVNTLRSDPSQLEAILKSNDDTVGKAGFTGDVAASVAKEYKSKSYTAVYEGKLDRADTPEQVLALKSDIEKDKGNIAPAEFDRLMNALDKAEDQKIAQREQVLVDDLEEHMQARLNGAAGNGFRLSDLNSMRDKKHANRLKRKLRQAEAVGAFADELRGKSAVEIDAIEKRVLADMTQGQGNYVVEAGQLRMIGIERARRRADEGAPLAALDDEIAAAAQGGDVDFASMRELAEGITDKNQRRLYKEKINIAEEVGAYSKELPTKMPADLYAERTRLQEEAKTTGRTDTAKAKIAAIDFEINKRRAAEAKFETGLKDTFADIADGEHTQNPATLRRQIDANVLDEHRRIALKQALDVAVAQGKAHASVPSMSSSELAARSLELQSAIDEAGETEYAVAVGRAKGFALAMKEREASLKRDPARHMIDNNTDVKKAHNAWLQAQQSDDVSPEDFAAARKRYVEAQKAEHQRQGRNPNDVRLLTSPEVAQIGVLMQATEPEMPRGAYVAEQLFKLKEKWGRDFKFVSKQLEAAGVFSGHDAVAAQVADRSVAKKLLEAAHAPDEVRKRKYDSLNTEATNTEIKNAVLTAMEDFRESLAQQPGGGDAIASYQNSVTLLTKEYMLGQGLDAETAAKRAANDLANNRYGYGTNRSGVSYRIPVTYNGQRIDADDMADKAAAVLTDGDFISEVTVPLSDVPDPDGSYHRTKYKNSLAVSGYWVTSPDEDGLVLYNGANKPVLNADGKTQFLMTWDALSAYTPIVAYTQPQGAMP